MGPATGSNGAAGSVIREEFERGGGGSYLSRSSRPSASVVGLKIASPSRPTLHVVAARLRRPIVSGRPSSAQ